MSNQLLNTPSQHPFSIAGLADSLWNGVSEQAIQLAWGPAAKLAKVAVVSVMQRISVGQLQIKTSSDVYSFPASTTSTGPKAELRVLKDTFWIRLCLMGDLGFSEAYMYGEVECDDLISLFKIFLANKDSLANLDSKLSYLFSLPQKLTSYRFLNTISNSRSNISAHYDISNEMFSGFLSPDMTYSCAIFPELDGDLANTESHNDFAILKRPFSSFSEHSVEKRASNGFLPSPPISEPISLEPRTDLDNSTSSTALEDTQDLLRVTSAKLHDAQAHGQSGPLCGHVDGVHKTESESDPNFDLEATTEDPVRARGPQENLDDPLFLAQLRKLDHIIAKLNIPSDRAIRLLEIGSGWGSLAMHIAERYPLVTIDTLTLSIQQKDLAEERIKASAQADAETHRRHNTDDSSPKDDPKPMDQRIRVHLMDYRSMPEEWESAFDRVVSIEMIEAVGYEFMEDYWKIVDWAMKRHNSAGVIQVITIPEARFEKYVNEIDFIRKWVLFPGGWLPSLTYLLSTLQSGTQGRLTVDSVSNIGPHYARTLREWRTRFLDRFDDVIKPALEKEYPDVMGAKGGEGTQIEKKALEEVEVFKRKWIYYYCYCEVGFSTRTLGDHIVTFTREGYKEYGCGAYE